MSGTNTNENRKTPPPPKKTEKFWEQIGRDRKSDLEKTKKNLTKVK